ncbi:F-box/LRR-repeat protein 3-like [Vespa velutina]|uniref:F-box/LRR-repeat protein 3-like n=1 Tax=Vespa velutina TaxID=202808 RepID=UPI001FB1C148|nr:F-box/LRR-repeat protein 3-like [Vespa velutina]XP_047346466.1 F-box/LRR-repeat protein 3-like [Vespa velutina]XP_047346467.1 F-box/LRR-repeat protein 3-like [Vespa velutina]XP_047346468.1 F-box/LRR-repeat protein 3-like [Vespa velutina]XP_047346469.1 F-box/LRR-repeat protein 3-like [Vespa velutina]
MLALINTSKSTYLDIDSEGFNTALTLSNEKTTIEQRKERREVEDNAWTKSLQLLRIRGSPHLLPEDILTLVNHCRCLRELSMSYTLLSDDLLMALCTEKEINLETLKIEVHSEIRPLPVIDEKVWTTFVDRFPNINLVLLSYITDEEEHKSLFTSHIPVTHLYFGEAPSESIALRIHSYCPRLMELVIAAYGPGLIDDVLINVARGCPHLNAIGLGDCEISCTGLLEFVTLCAERLKILYIRETSLIENSELDVLDVTAKVSSLLGDTWVPEYIPLW